MSGATDAAQRRRWRKRGLLALLGSLLVAWFVVEYLRLGVEEARYERQMLRVEAVEVTQPEAPDAALADALGAALEDEALTWIASCLMTDEASLAPASLQARVDPGGALGEARWSATTPLDADTERCLAASLGRVRWPQTEAPTAMTVLLVPRAQP